MTISTGDKIPGVTVKTNGPDGPADLHTDELFAGKRVVLFGVPGPFTPGCSNTHMPGFVTHADDILARGVDIIACMSVADAFVMDAWQRDQNAGQITMVADGNAELTRALGLDMDASKAGMGTRCKRFALIADDGVVSYIGIDPKGVDRSSAETILENL